MSKFQEALFMKALMVLLIAILQLIVGSMLGFAAALLLGLGNGWELVVFVVGYSLGVWGIGTLASLRDWVHKESSVGTPSGQR